MGPSLRAARSRLLGVGAALALACGHRAPTERAVPQQPAALPAVDPPAVDPPAAAPPVVCGPRPTGLSDILHPGALVVFGEVHGTAETPAFVANVACHAAASGAEVAVGMEISRELQPALDRFLDSSGGPDDVTALLQGEHWSSEDGRASKAYVGVIDEVRALRRSGKKARLFFFDAAETDSGDRDQNMAANIAAQADKSAQGITLVLTGGLHARTDSERWMSWHLARRYPGLRTLNVAFSGGSAHVCLTGNQCGVLTEMTGTDRGTVPLVEVFAAPDEQGYGGRFYVGGAVTASPPVKHEGELKILPLSPRKQARKARAVKDYPSCAKLFAASAADDQGPVGANDLYSAAACDALGGDPTAALTRLARAVDRGFVDVARLEADPDLVALHTRRAWKPLLAKLRARARTPAPPPSPVHHERDVPGGAAARP
ncbi:MAG: hypothetical protein ABIY55_13965 [Kofleriaceae bacterium]